MGWTTECSDTSERDLWPVTEEIVKLELYGERNECWAEQNHDENQKNEEENAKVDEE